MQYVEVEGYDENRNPKRVRVPYTDGGATLVSDAALDYISYSDATYDYYCEAEPGTALATAAWRIVRKNRSTGHWQHASLGAFSNAATDLATVQGAFA